MAITPNFNEADVKGLFNNFLQVLEKRAIARFQYLGELCVTHARTSGNYTDRTGNLRSSVGYTIFKDGVAIQEAFVGTGASKGKAVAKKAGTKHKKGITLVVVAGMEYALAVESRGKDVLTSAENLAKTEVPRILDALKANIKATLS